MQSPHSCSEVVVTDVGGGDVRSLAAVPTRMMTEWVRIELPGRFAFDALWSLWASGPPWVAERAAAVSRSWPSPAPAAAPGSCPGTRVRVYVFAAAQCGAAAGQAVPWRRWRAGYRLTAHLALPAGLVS